jgi:glycerophosphoryl diester phosphodiesterase
MRVIGHRGARFEAPENTLPGFRYALGLGLDGFEFDIHLTRDEQLVVIHDATVDRTTNGTGRVADLSLAEIQALDARATFPDWPEPCRVPTYADVLGMIGHVPWLETEIKTDTPDRLDIVLPKVVETIRRFGIDDHIIITSFDPYALEVAKRIAPEIRRGFISRWDSERDLEIATSLEVALVGIPYATGKLELVQRAQAAGMLASGWPTNSPEAFESALTLGVDAICTDAPTAMKALMTERANAV